MAERRADAGKCSCAKGGKTRLRDLILLYEAHHVIVHALGYQITTAEGAFTFARPDGQPLPNAPDLPGSHGDLAGCHDSDITTETIIPHGLADKLDLDLGVLACFANARVAAERASQQREQDLAARTSAAWPIAPQATACSTGGRGYAWPAASWIAISSTSFWSARIGRTMTVKLTSFCAAFQRRMSTPWT
jgi:hypothetical protein